MLLNLLWNCGHIIIKIHMLELWTIRSFCLRSFSVIWVFVEDVCAPENSPTQRVPHIPALAPTGVAAIRKRNLIMESSEVKGIIFVWRCEMYWGQYQLWARQQQQQPCQVDSKWKIRHFYFSYCFFILFHLYFIQCNFTECVYVIEMPFEFH